MRYYSYPNRTLCAVLEEMRDCFKTYNFAPIKGLIEEAQSLGNRMEAGLSDVRDAEDMRREKRRLKKQIAKLEDKLEKLEEK